MLAEARDNGLIKVVTGMRRSGKSSLMALGRDDLLAQGVPADRIVFLNLESFEFVDYDFRQLYHEVERAVRGKGHCYVFLDEVQLIGQWQKAVNAMRVDLDIDLVITGSNAHMLSSELSTLLSGRFMEIRVFPLSYREFLEYAELESSDASFERFCRFGALPPVVDQGDNPALARTVLAGIYNTVVVRDVASHMEIRNSAVFDDVARYVFDTAGSPVSVAKIEKRLASAHRKTTAVTIERYIKGMEEAYLLNRIPRVDAHGGRILQGLSKCYPSDTGIGGVLLGGKPYDFGFVLENVVCNELLAAGYHVRVGRTDRLEIDFVAWRDDVSGESDVAGDGLSSAQADSRSGSGYGVLGARPIMIQVTASILDASTRKRELEPLRAVRDVSARRMVITLNHMGLETVDGIEIVNALDWLNSLPSGR